MFIFSFKYQFPFFWQGKKRNILLCSLPFHIKTMQFNIIKFLFFLFFPFILHQQLANSVSSSNSWQEDAWNEMDLEGKDMNGCIWKNYAKSEEAKTECDQLWRLYDPIEVNSINVRNLKKFWTFFFNYTWGKIIF